MSPIRTIRGGVWPFLLILLFSLPPGAPMVGGTLHAQTPSGILEGRVIEEGSGTPLAGAVVEVPLQNRQARAGADGSFRLTGLPVGSLEVVARHLDRNSRTRTVEIRAGETTQVEIVLTSSPLALNRITVTATRTPRDLQEVPASLSLVSGSEIALRGALYQGEELVGIPGVTVGGGYEGTYTSLTLRGVPSDHHNDTFVGLVDGVPFVTNSDEVDLERMMPLALMERVEVVRGPMSALYGRGGVAGVVNYITRPAMGAPSLEGALLMGNYGLFRPELSLSAPVAGDRGRLMAHGFVERKDGWRERSDREAENLFLRADWILGPSTELSSYFNFNQSAQGFASHLPLRQDGSMVDVAGGPAANHQIDDVRDERRVWLGTLRLDHRPREDLRLRTTAQYRDNRFFTNLGFVAGLDEETETMWWSGYSAESLYSTLFVEPQLTWESGRLRLVTGGSYERVDGRSETNWTGEHGFTPGVGFLFYTQRRNYRTGEMLNREAWVSDQRLDVEYLAGIGAAYAQAEVDLGARSILTAGMRYDRYRREAIYGDLAPRGDPVPGETVEDSDGHLSPKVAFLVRWTPDLSSYVSFGEGFSPAFGSVGAFRGRDPSLRPEIARNVEAGIRGSALGGRLTFSSALYHLNRSDLVITVYGTGDERFRRVNAGKQRSRGLELEGTVDLSGALPGVSLFGSYAFTDSRFTDYRFVDSFSDEEFDFTGNRPAGVPEHAFTLGSDLRLPGGVHARLWYDHTGARWMDRPNTRQDDGFGLLNASATLRTDLLPGADVRFVVTNLTDREHFSYDWWNNHRASAAFPGRPREVQLGIRWRR